MSKAKNVGRAPAARPVGPKTRRLNVRALVLLAVVAAVGVAGFFATKVYRGRVSRSTYLARARNAVDANRPDLALPFVNGYLEVKPNDLEALDLKGRLLTKSARDQAGIVEALAVENQILARDPGRAESRRRLIELNLKVGAYRAAQVAAQELIKRGAGDAGAHRLLARSLEGAGLLGDPKAFDEAILEYEKAETLEPGDVGGMARLAELYRTKNRDEVKALAVMDNLLKLNPKSTAVRLARFRFFLTGPGGSARVAEATLEIDEAIRLAPNELDSRLVAAELAAQRGDGEAARGHLAAIPAASADDLRVKLVRGMVELQERRTDEAIQIWRSGLIQTGGTDADLTWRLARVFLEMGRVREAEPLMAQYRRLVGGTEPTPEYRFLVALLYLRVGRAADAVAELEATRDKIDRGLAPQHMTALGRGYESIRDEPKAIEAYRRAAAMAGAGPQPWLALARIQMAGRPADAATALEQGLTAAPDDPKLLVALCQILWQKEAAKAKERRNWSEFERRLARAEAVAPGSPEVAVIRADYLAATGRLEDGLKMLGAATAKAPGSVALWLARANVLTRLGRVDEAIGVLESASKAAGEDASLRSSRAALLLRKGESRPALDLLTEGLDKVPADQKPLIWKALGELYQGQTNYLAAKTAFGEWALLQPDAAEPRIAMLNLAVSAGDDAGMEAQVAALKATGGPKSLTWKIARVEMLLYRKDAPAGDPAAKVAANPRLDEAAGLIAEVKAAVPLQPSGLILEARLMEQRGRPDDAILAYQKALDLNGGQVALRPLVALLVKQQRREEIEALRTKVASFPPDLDRLASAMTLQLGDAEKAEQMAVRMAQGDPQSLDAAVWKARVLNTLGKAEEAEESIRILTKQRPEDPAPWLQLFMFQAARKDLAGARATLDEMKRRAKPDRPELLWTNCYRVLGALDQADASLEVALRRWPDEPKVRQAAVDYYEATGRPLLAERSFRHVLKVAPDLDWARRRLALLLSARPNDKAAWDEAMALVGEVPKGGESPDDRLTRATVLARSAEPGRRAEAIRTLESLAAEIPNSSKLREVLARALLTAGRGDDARAQAARSASAEDASPDAILLHASLSLRAKDLPEAERQLVRLTAFDPDALPSVELKARVLHAKGDDAGAVEAVRKALDARKAAPDRLAVGIGMLQLLLDLNLPDAAEQIGPVVAGYGPRGQIALAELLGARKKDKEARVLIASAFKAGADADAIRADLTLGGEGGDPAYLEQADALIRDALVARPGALDLLQAQAYLRHLQGNYAEEVRLYTDIIGKSPSEFMFMNNMAWTLSEELGKPDEGLTRIDEAIGKVGRQHHLLDTRGVILLRLKRPDEAIVDLEAAVASIRTAPVLYHLARAYKMAGKVAESDKYRDLARAAGIRLDQLQPSERAEAEALLASPPPAAGPAAKP